MEKYRSTHIKKQVTKKHALQALILAKTKSHTQVDKKVSGRKFKQELNQYLPPTYSNAMLSISSTSLIGLFNSPKHPERKM